MWQFLLASGGKFHSPTRMYEIVNTVRSVHCIVFLRLGVSICWSDVFHLVDLPVAVRHKPVACVQRLTSCGNLKRSIGVWIPARVDCHSEKWDQIVGCGICVGNPLTINAMPAVFLAEI